MPKLSHSEKKNAEIRKNKRFFLERRNKNNKNLVVNIPFSKIMTPMVHKTRCFTDINNF